MTVVAGSVKPLRAQFEGFNTSFAQARSAHDVALESRIQRALEQDEAEAAAARTRQEERKARYSRATQETREKGLELTKQIQDKVAKAGELEVGDKELLDVGTADVVALLDLNNLEDL